MKSRLILLLLIIFSGIFSLASAQAVFWEETFDSDPGTWTLESNWVIQYGALELYWFPQIDNYDLSAISPVINLPGNVGDLVVTQWISTYSIVDEVAEISVLYNGSEDIIWSYEMINGDWAEIGGDDLVLSLFPYAGLDIQLKFRSFGSSTWNFNNWTIYNLVILAMYDNDLAAVEIIGPPNAEQNVEDTWSVKVENKGLNTQVDYSVQLYKEGGFEIGSIEGTIPLESTEIAIYDFNWTPTELGDTYIYGYVTLDNDEFLDNNTTPDFDVFIYPQGALQVLIWDYDNGSYYLDPENLYYVGCEFGLEGALTSNEIEFTTVIELPPVLYNYDMVFVTLGLYCVG